MAERVEAGTNPGKAASRFAGRTARVKALLRRPEVVALLPAAPLAAYVLGGEIWLIATSVALPTAFAVAALTAPLRRNERTARDTAGPPTTGRPHLEAQLGGFLDQSDGQEQRTACLVVVIDDAPALRDRYGPSGWDLLFQRTLDRTRTALRESDAVTPLDTGRIGIALAPGRRIDLEAVLQIGARLQDTLATAISLDGVAVHLTVSVGFCLASRAPAPGAAALLAAAEAAGEHARRYGPAALRAFTPEVAAAEAGIADLRAEVAGAIEQGQIVAYYQPQLSTETGQVSGFEALARWLHPGRGLIPPGDFLPLIESCGLCDRLGETIRTQAFRALAAWDRAGHVVPSVGINFSTNELRDPHLPDRIAWELDRHDLKPGRLTVEILESVAAGAEDDMIVRNLARLGAMGCGIDLDDFGTGQAGIANIRRFGVRRLKIDRSFVRQIDQDRDQQAVLAGILSLAERLGLDSIGEGVETAGEHAVLAQLGCGHVQGFAIARPMPLADTLPWLQARARTDTPIPGLQMGRKNP